MTISTEHHTVAFEGHCWTVRLRATGRLTGISTGKKAALDLATRLSAAIVAANLPQVDVCGNRLDDREHKEVPDA